MAPTKGWLHLDTYQNAVTQGSIEKPDSDSFIVAVLGCAGEAGEIADLVKKSYHRGGDLDRGRVVEELGDLLWYVTRLASLLDCRLEEVAYSNMRKLADRHPDEYGFLFNPRRYES